MLKKHQPHEIEIGRVDNLAKKTQEIIAQMPKINELEKVLEVQDEDKELTLLSQDMEKAVKGARNKILKANQEI